MLIATLRNGEPAPALSLMRVASTRPFVPRDIPLPQSRPFLLEEGR